MSHYARRAVRPTAKHRYGDKARFAEIGKRGGLARQASRKAGPRRSPA